MKMLTRKQIVMMCIAFIASVLAAILTHIEANAVLTFIIAGLAVAMLASIVGEATEQLGEILGPGATGVLQSGIGNLPELFVCIFALKAGLVTVVQTALIGSILANSLLTLGLAFTVGGLKNGTQKFHANQPRNIALLTLLSVSALMIPTLAFQLHTPASGHENGLSIACAVLLLLIFAASIPMSLKDGPTAVMPSPTNHHAGWPLWLSIVVLACSGLGAAFVSDWFVEALSPAIKALNLSEAFAGFVIVAIASNAVENFIGIQLAAQNKSDYAISVILNSSLQVALALLPVLVLISFVIGAAPLTLVLPPMLIVTLFLSAIIGAFVVYDGESNWLEGLILMGLYGIIAASFWWG